LIRIFNNRDVKNSKEGGKRVIQIEKDKEKEKEKER
jgi:hypothetical protein